MRKPFAMRNIAALRARDGLSQTQLGELIGVSQQAVQKWENGVSSPKLRQVLRMADAFDCSIETLIGRAPVEKRRATLCEKLLEFKALDEGLPAAADVDPLTRSVFDRYHSDPEHLDKVSRSMLAVLDMKSRGGADSLTEMIEAVLAA